MSIIDGAKSGITEEIRMAAERNGAEPELVRRGVAAGRIVIPRNPAHNCQPIGIGEGLSIKINANIGTSKDFSAPEEELEKARVAVQYGADAVMDLSTGGDIDAIRASIMKNIDVPIGTVPIYQAGIETARCGAVVDMDEDKIFNAIEKHAKDGVDFMTVHCGVTKESVGKLLESSRLTDVVSRGGSFLAAWILHHGMENPLYENYDYLLEMARKYEFTLSLGDGFRPGSIHDAGDSPQIQELIILGECVERARAKGVQAIVEGPGHVPLNQIQANVEMEKTICKGAPFYVLGPLVTDISPGYDHITGAIGGALAGYFGADFLCYVTPSEHLCLPAVDDVREGVIASKIAAHAGDLARGNAGAWERDNKLSAARKRLDWNEMIRLSVDPEKAKRYRDTRPAMDDADTCSMCGDICAIKLISQYLEKNR